MCFIVFQATIVLRKTLILLVLSINYFRISTVIIILIFHPCSYIKVASYLNILSSLPILIIIRILFFIHPHSHPICLLIFIWTLAPLTLILVILFILIYTSFSSFSSFSVSSVFLLHFLFFVFLHLLFYLLPHSLLPFPPVYSSTSYS